MSIDESLLQKASIIPSLESHIFCTDPNKKNVSVFRRVNEFQAANCISGTGLNPYQLSQECHPLCYRKGFQVSPNTLMNGSTSLLAVGSSLTNETNDVAIYNAEQQSYLDHFRPIPSSFVAEIPHSQQQWQPIILPPLMNVAYPRELNMEFSSKFESPTVPELANLPPIQTYPVTPADVAEACEPDPVPLESLSEKEIKGNDSSSPNAVELDDLTQFAQQFKERRIQLGFSQYRVGSSLGNLCGRSVNRQTISRFERRLLSFEQMCNLKPLLSSWIEETYRCPTLEKKRKPRTSFGDQTLILLENFFIQKRKPTMAEIVKISEQLQLKKQIVCVW